MTLSIATWFLILLGLFGDYPQPGNREPCFDARHIMLYDVRSADFICTPVEFIELYAERIEGGTHRLFWRFR